MGILKEDPITKKFGSSRWDMTCQGVLGIPTDFDPQMDG